MATPSRPQGSVPENSVDAAIKAPSISLPKGGGAIRGIGEKFATNPVTGTGSMNIPIVTSPGRGGFGPQLSLSYDSGAGNGPFGFGWNISLPSISRKTDKGLPKYVDSDVLILSGAEDLVPVLENDGSRFEESASSPDYLIHRYRPRIEGLFARIERWTNKLSGDVHWRSISKENILSIYGKDLNSRVYDPQHPFHIFSWLICETRDDKGNAIIYEYKEEDGAGIDLARAHERNRGNDESNLRTANRYIKRILYGNRVTLLDENGDRPRFIAKAEVDAANWMFELVFDYGDHHATNPSPKDEDQWPVRLDPFSTYRSGFEVRTYRLCRRALVFHHFAAEEFIGRDCLVRSTKFDFDESPIASLITSVTQIGHKRTSSGDYLEQSLPPLAFEYSQAVLGKELQTVDTESMGNLPQGVDGSVYQWVDLDGEGLTGALSEQANQWLYKPSRPSLPVDGQGNQPVFHFESTQQRLHFPNGNLLSRAQWQFLDLAGDGKIDLASFSGPIQGFYERTNNQNWEPFRAFLSIPNIVWDDPNLKFIDLTGDGHADVLISEDDAFTWHQSHGEEGFGAAARVTTPLDEESGPRVIFADGSQTISLADFSGDGLTDIVRIRNGEVCYWPNLGYGRFGAKVTMDDSPWFDLPDQFDPRRIRLADIDGSGVTDIIYLGRDRIRFWYNQAGNSWGGPNELPQMPQPDNIASVTVADLLGNGTACLVWSSPLENSSRMPMRYLPLMAEGKPHLLIRTINNLGAETRVHYAPSTYFFLRDKQEGRPWITRLAFPVHVVERVETYDYISRNHFVTRYRYHHGYFDGAEREFRGFGMVEEEDTEEFGAIGSSEDFPTGENVDTSSHVAPIRVLTWFHTGAFIDRNEISAAFVPEFYREPGLNDDQARDNLVPSPELPEGLSADEQREACRALKGSMLRQEIYAMDKSPKEDLPYSVTQQSFKVRRLQPRGDNRHSVFLTYPDQALSSHYERNPTDPRVSHSLTIEVDNFGNVTKAASVGYGRKLQDADLHLEKDLEKQQRDLVTFTLSSFTNEIDRSSIDDYRAPMLYETRTYQLTGFAKTGAAGRFDPSDFVDPDVAEPSKFVLKNATEIPYESEGSGANKRRLIELTRTLFRKDDLTGLFKLGEQGNRGQQGESYKLAFTSGLLAAVFKRRSNGLLEDLLPDVETIVGEQAGYVASRDMKTAGLFPNLDADTYWWIPSGRVFLSPDKNDTALEELAFARNHFFMPYRFVDAFNHETRLAYDSDPGDPTRNHNLMLVETEDALGNITTVRTKDENGHTKICNDYRVLQPYWITDVNGNRARSAFDALGMVVATAIMGKAPPEPPEGDSLEGFEADLTQEQNEDFFGSANPRIPAMGLLGSASTRIMYDLHCFRKSVEAFPERPEMWQPVYAATLARETHVSDPTAALKIQVGFSYSDGFGREIQKKIQAEQGPIQKGGPNENPRWVATGWTVFNNKGKPVRQYEPFFSASHQFEFGIRVGKSPILFYDPAERVVAKLHPNHSYEKVVFDPWQQISYDVNDTSAARDGQSGDPRADGDIAGYVANYFLTEPATWQTWHAQRIAGSLGPRERKAALKTALHAATPTKAYFDTLGRPFLTVSHNRYETEAGTQDEKYASRVELDIEGNQREVRDAIVQASDSLGRIVMRYDYDMLGNRIHQASMEAGERWMLNDVTGKPIRAWDSRGHTFRTEYDPLRRPLRSYVIGANADHPNREILSERFIYGEQHPQAKRHNLRGKAYLHLEQSGLVANEEHDFKGNLKVASRRLAREYKSAVNWQDVDDVLGALPADAHVDTGSLDAELDPFLEAKSETYTSLTSFDALNRPVSLTTPHTAAMNANVVHPIYNEANLLEQVEVNLNGAGSVTRFVADIDYDAKGQRERIEYGNGVVTDYRYDEDTFRLIHLKTMQGAQLLQDLSYTYDPAGNITEIKDDAQQSVYFRNARVDPSAEYTYDAIYRLIEANGREQLGVAGGSPFPHDHNDANRMGIPHRGDRNALGLYTEKYTYDAVGNFSEMRHRSSDPAGAGWTRAYAYNEPSLTEPAKQSNRLSSTQVGGGPVPIHTYDEHGNMLSMPHLSWMQWDFRDQLQATARQVVGSGDPETTWYVYDSGGQRVRKITEHADGRVKDERIYLGGLEIYRKAGEDPLTRETLHVMDDKQRIALVETRTQGNDGSPQELIRYQYGNHLGSAVLELGKSAEFISYEEYTPYGSTSYQAVTTDLQVPTKRCRFTGKERDEENGFYYHGARYYAPWLGRWTSCDPAELKDGENLYLFSRNNPIKFVDPNGKQSVADYYRFIHFQHEVHETIKPVVKTMEATGQITEGVGEGVWGMAKGIARTAYLSLTPWGKVKLAQETAQSVKTAYIEGSEYGGGVSGGLLNTVNVINPFYSMLVAGAKTKEAWETGDYRSVGREGFSTTVSAASVVGVALAGAGVAKGLAAKGEAPVTVAAAEGTAENAARAQLLETLRLRARQLELGSDPATGRYRQIEGTAGVKLEQKLGRQIQRGKHEGIDFEDPVLGPISLKGPLPAKGDVMGLAESAIRDTWANTATKTLVIDTLGLSSQQVSTLKSVVEAGAKAKGSKKNIIFLE